MTTSPLTGSLLEEQIALELNSVSDGVSRYRRLAEQAIHRGEGAALKPAERLIVTWMGLITEGVRHERRDIVAGRSSVGRGVYGPAFLQVDPAKAALIATHEMLGKCMSSPYGAELPRVAEAIGRAMNAEANLPVLRKERDVWRQVVRRHKHVDPKLVLRETKRLDEEYHWGRSVHHHVGTVMVKIVLAIAGTLDEQENFVPAFENKLVRIQLKTHRMLVLSRQCREIIEEGHALRQHLRPRYRPMVVPPLPWSEDSVGGYLRLRTQLMKKMGPSQRRLMAEADLSLIHEAVNALNAVAWRIDGQMLKEIERYHEQLGIGRDIPLPDKPSDIATNEDALKQWKREASEVYSLNEEAAARRVTFGHKLQVGLDASKYEAVWFPHQLDTRGRVYPKPLHLNHQGDDECRGVLRFATKKRLGSDGLRWLKIHTAGMLGAKGTHERLVEWIDEGLDEIVQYGSANYDVGDKKRWQAQAACDELAKAIRSGKPNEFYSDLPVQVDGSCNGLQHYAALGLDEDGARLVNVLPTDEPNSVYNDIADYAAKLARDDGVNGNLIAKDLSDRDIIDKNLVKQTVMTVVYGVTPIGARQQVYAQLADAGMDFKERFRASRYLSAAILEAVRAKCPAAAAIMDWMQLCARMIAKDAGQVVQWTTPLNLPVLQNYRNRKNSKITTILQRIDLIQEHEGFKPSVRKQVNAFPPNYIHSIDSTHMMMTATECAKLGIDFAEVHDAFWTHAATMSKLQDVIKEQFVKLHEIPLLDALHSELQEQHPSLELPPPPPQGDLDLSQVLRSRYMFS